MIAAIAAVEEHHVVMKKEVHMALDEETTKIFVGCFPEYSVSVVKHGKHKGKLIVRLKKALYGVCRTCAAVVLSSTIGAGISRLHYES
jgi:hypothetical protein